MTTVDTAEPRPGASVQRRRQPTAPGALDGLLIADFSRVLAGPYATMLLADLGAEVVKVERPGSGDDTRSWGPPFDSEGQATYYQGVNRNKRSAALDLASTEGRAIARRLVATADVVVENFRPGTMERLDLDYDSARQLNPDVVYCSITGFGSGPGASLPGYDLLVQAVGGLMSLTGPAPGAPTKVGVALVDVLTGLHACVGILAAVRHRERTGRGQRVEVNLLSSLLSGLVNQGSAFVGGGVVPGILGNRHPSIAPYEVLETADCPLVVAVGNDRQFSALADLLDRPDLASDPRFVTNTDRVHHRDELAGELEAELRGRPSSEWIARCSAAGVPAGPINDVREAFALAEEFGLEPVVQIEDPRRDRCVTQVANPIGLSATPPRYTLAPPRLGEDTDRVAGPAGPAPDGDE